MALMVATHVSSSCCDCSDNAGVSSISPAGGTPCSVLFGKVHFFNEVLVTRFCMQTVEERIDLNGRHHEDRMRAISIFKRVQSFFLFSEESMHFSDGIK